MRRVLLPLVIPLAAAAIGAGVWWATLGDALDTAAAKGRSDLGLAADRLELELQRARDLAVHLSDHPVLLRRDARAEGVLRAAADRTGAAGAALVDADGGVVAAAGAVASAAHADRPWIARARQGALGYGPDPEARAFVHAAPVFGADGRVAGAVVVSRDLVALRDRWSGEPRAIYYTDAAGRILLSNRRELDGVLPPHVRRDRYGHDLRRFEGEGARYLPRVALHLTRSMPRLELTAEILLDAAPAFALAQARGVAAGAVALVIGAALWLLAARRASLARRAARLEGQVARRTAALAREAEERREAEAALTRARAELVQAGRLGALGQMAAGISHELNQPLMAIRSFAQNGRTLLERGDGAGAGRTLARVGDLAERMGRIIRHLNAFARAEPERPEAVDLRDAVREALDMLAPRVEAAGAELTVRLPDGPVPVMGGTVRLGQVVTNLVTNALDASGPGGHVEVVLEGDPPRLTVRDDGPGLAEPQRVFDPFYTTKGVGEGLGLGLSISYGIVSGFGGTLRAENRPEGGAAFEVVLQPAATRAVAA